MVKVMVFRQLYKAEEESTFQTLPVGSTHIVCVHVSAFIPLNMLSFLLTEGKDTDRGM